MGNFLHKHLICLLFVVIISSCVSNGEVGSGSFLVKCGSSAIVTVNGRTWVGDLVPNNNISRSSAGFAVNISNEHGDSTFSPLYNTARVFTSGLNYTFQGMRGRYFVRLYFWPFSSQSYKANSSLFSIVANGLKLVSEFNIPSEISYRSLNMRNPNGNATSVLIKEYILLVKSDVLVIELIPSKGSFGFINAIEIVPAIGDLFIDLVSRVGETETNLNVSERGIETMYRLNVGGPEMKSTEDPELWRTWEVDSSYMITESAGYEIRNASNITYASDNDSLVAPLTVYETARTMSNTQVLEKRFNMSWKFAVDPDFDYLVRLHFCELEFNKANWRVFTIYINNKTAADNFDVYVRAEGKNKAIHQDFFDVASSKIDMLWIQLGSDTAVGSSGTDALLNGLEIFKLGKNGNLASAERLRTSGDKERNSNSKILWIGIGAGVSSILFLGMALTLIFFFWKRQREACRSTKNSPPGWRPLFLHGSVVSSIANAKGGTQNVVGSARVGKRFMLVDICAATNSFDESLVIGIGGFGKVYKGEIEDGMLVAIKRSNPQSEQGLSEFETEIEMLSKLRHRHLVSLIGFCEEQNEMILVYEFMANGTFRSHLFGSGLPPLTWKQRLEACIGAARGLHYLHTGSDRGIIHRDVKTTNILLDENLVAKMSDFGLSRTGPAWDHTHVSTAVKGSFGYLDPEYFCRQHLTEKSDVYSFGVVLFEVVCARAVIDPSLPKDQINLAEWAMRWHRQRSLEAIIDPHLRGNFCPESLQKFGDIAEKCLADEGKNRPTMGEVLWHLEYVLQLHEAWIRSNQVANSLTSNQALEDLEERAS